MIHLRTSLTTLLKSVHPNVNFEQAPKDQTFPYIVFNFLPSFQNEDQEVVVMDVDVWDNKSDTTEIETLANTIWRALNKYHYIDENIQFTIYKSTRFPELEDNNPLIKRRKLTFEVKYFDRE